MKKVLLLFATLFALGQNAFAIYDFYATAPSGQTLYYRISGGNAIVTYPGYNSDYAYYNYGKPTGNLIIPDSVTNGGITYAVISIDDYAFIDCDNGPQLGGTRLNTVTIPNTVTSIGACAFKDCNGLTSVSIPNSVTYIGSSAFSGCTSLSSINIPDLVTSINSGTFYHCTSLTSINIPSSVTSIGSSAFQNCNGLTSVTIPDSVFGIDHYAFAQCYHLESVTLGSGVIYISNGAFEDCHDIMQMTCNATVPPSAWANTFSGVDRTIPLYVPISSISSYQAAPVWSEFTNYIGGTTENTATATVTISQITATSAHLDIVMGDNTSYFILLYGPQSTFVQNGLTTDAAIINYVIQNYDAPANRYYNNMSGYMNGLAPNTTYWVAVVPFNNNGTAGTMVRDQFTTLNETDPATVTATISEVTATSAHAEIVMGQQTSYFYLIYAPQSVFTQNGLTTDESIISYVNQNYGSSDRNYNNVSGYMNDLTPNTTYMLVVVPYNSNDEVGTITRKQFTTLNNNGIEDVGEEEYAISSQDGRLTVSGAEGNMVNVYSLDGRCIYSASAKGTTVIDIPASGTYLVKIGRHPARKVVVIK